MLLVRRTSRTSFFAPYDRRILHNIDISMMRHWKQIGKLYISRSFFQKGVVHIVVRLLRDRVPLDDFAPFFSLQTVCCNVINDLLLASLGGSDASLFVFKNASFTIAKQVFLHLLCMVSVNIFVMAGRHVIGR